MKELKDQVNEFVAALKKTYSENREVRNKAEQDLNKIKSDYNLNLLIEPTSLKWLIIKDRDRVIASFTFGSGDIFQRINYHF